MKQKFSFKLRLYKKAHFKNVFQKGKKIVCKNAAVFFCRNSQKQPRIGIVVSRKNINRANVRNKIKRIVREVFRKKQNELAPIDIVVLVYKEAATATNKELFECIEMQLQKIEKASLKGP